MYSFHSLPMYIFMFAGDNLEMRLILWRVLNIFWITDLHRQLIGRCVDPWQNLNRGRAYFNSFFKGGFRRKCIEDLAGQTFPPKELLVRQANRKTSSAKLRHARFLARCKLCDSRNKILILLVFPKCIAYNGTFHSCLFQAAILGILLHRWTHLKIVEKLRRRQPSGSQENLLLTTPIKYSQVMNDPEPSRPMKTVKESSFWALIIVSEFDLAFSFRSVHHPGCLRHNTV